MGRNVTIANLAAIAAAKAARPAVFKPQKVNGVWHEPKWSRREIANERKRVLRAGGTWKWDIPKKEIVKKIEFKGHKRDLERAERLERIEAAMKKMPALIAEYRASRRQRKKHVGLAEVLFVPREPPAPPKAKKGKGKGKKQTAVN